ncbi:hypothetical protein [Marinospirillum perlucidum]|uniref:hypothetical protein n=1 Tax=Marinospirillum perlucidum TaxID=1982602 RepID=UPI000DF266E0|nr:hypothetical protein [Marinospirillum perlucidum]
MKKMLWLLLLLPGTLWAGPFTDQMSRCLVEQTTAAEKREFVRWIYAAMSKHPEVSALANISDAEAVGLNQSAGRMLTELMTERCRQETSQAVQYEGNLAIETSFGVLGQVAMQELMTDPDVNAYFESLSNYVDEKRLREVLGNR